MKYSPYSFSKINTFFDCQKKFELTYVNKVAIDRDYTDPTYFVRGRFLHAYIANRLKGGNGMKLKGYNAVDTDDKLNLVEYADSTLENEYIGLTYDFNINMIEAYISLDKNLEPARNKALSVIGGYIDYFAIQDDYAMMVDWKTGRYHSHPRYTQLELYAIWLFQSYPEITEIDLVFYYVEHNKFNIKTVVPSDVETLKNELMDKIDFIENTDTFNTNDSIHCIKCPFFNTCMDEYGVTGLNT
jgi:CRISPR/Cas system-associated exonuclease Cas4 (RecB family)